MDRSTVFYFVFGAAIVAIPALADRSLQGRVSDRMRFVLGVLVAVATGMVLVLGRRILEL